MNFTTAITPKNRNGNDMSKSSSSRDSGIVTTVMIARANPIVAKNLDFSNSKEYRPQAMAGAKRK
jgi:hypothetical protein